MGFFIVGMIVLNFWLDLNKEEIFSRLDNIFIEEKSVVISLEQKAGAFLGSSLVFPNILEEGG